MSKGNLFVISGASGVGKSTVLGKVMAAREDLQFSVSATTRSPRPGEVDGKSYYFVTHETFEQMISEDAFVEYDCHMANYYGIRDLEEAKDYMEHPVLGPRLIEITEALLALDSSDPGAVMGFPDDLKLCSCMTLFELAAPEEKVFAKVLDKFYHGRRDGNTLRILGIR